ncbi:hypothetical protein [Natronococcus jeotgali]|uniref:Uncharacterized protein n=1 Tax=Natronococcus jeotgali DSM 18795 TaxID=1227498 RepID=L9XPF9_9EURY|nr:hypothetical protein [Natronococcus jeotgali]ELY63412.1 hypothetical protein C492_07230 [Natronococcus jeotgali DSM 18795]
MDDDDIASAATRFHEDVPHQFQVSLTMSMETRERLRATQEELNDRVGERLFTTNDVMRIALVGASQYHALATGETDELTDELESVDEEQLQALTGVVRSVLDDDGAIDRVDGETT